MHNMNNNSAQCHSIAYNVIIHRYVLKHLLVSWRIATQEVQQIWQVTCHASYCLYYDLIYCLCKFYPKSRLIIVVRR